jgi:uncharacterized protein (UPF0335 family)
MIESTDDRLRLLIERIERLADERQGIQDDIKDVYAEAKSAGYIPKVMREIVKLRKMERSTRQEHDAILDVYRSALGVD